MKLLIATTAALILAIVMFLAGRYSQDVNGVDNLANQSDRRNVESFVHVSGNEPEYLVGQLAPCSPKDAKYMLELQVYFNEDSVHSVMEYFHYYEEEDSTHLYGGAFSGDYFCGVGKDGGFSGTQKIVQAHEEFVLVSVSWSCLQKGDKGSYDLPLLFVPDSSGTITLDEKRHLTWTFLPLPKDHDDR